MSSSKFWSFDQHQAFGCIADAQVEIVIGHKGNFAGDVACAPVGRFNLLRVALQHKSLCVYGLPAERVVVAFPISSAKRQVWQGETLRLGELIVIGPGGSLYQAIEGTAAWGWVTMPVAALTDWCRMLSGNPDSKPVSGSILRPMRSAFDRLAGIYSEALDLVNRAPKVPIAPEVSRSIEQELIHALVTCLTSTGTRGGGESAARSRRRHVSLMLDFDGYLDTFPEQSLSIAEIGEELDVGERTLRLVCKRFTGVSPRRYSAIRRMNAARMALLEANSRLDSVSSIARTFGFTQPGRFAVRYRQLFGVNPMTTLQATYSPPE